MDVTNVTSDDRTWKDHLRARKLTNIWKFYDCFQKQKRIPFDDIFTDYAVWIMNGKWTESVPFAGTYQGKEEITKLFESYFKAIRIIEFDHEYEIVDGSEVVVHFNLKAKVLATDKAFDMEFFDHFKVDEKAKILFCRRYYDTFTFTLPFKAEGPSHIVDVKTNKYNHKINLNANYDAARCVWQIYENFYAGRLEEAKSGMNPNFEVSYKGPGLESEHALIPYPGKYYGASGVDRFMINLGTTATMNFIDRYFLVEGNCVEIIFYEDWTVIENGRKYSVYTLNNWILDEDGKALEMMCSPDTYEIAKAYNPDRDL
jgi:ketosteroid isomerase-like protein